MKKLWICYFAALCIVLSGCAGNRQEGQKSETPEQEDTQQEAQDRTSAEPSQAKDPETSAELDSVPEDDRFSGRWQAVETPQYYMDIASGGGDSYSPPPYGNPAPSYGGSQAPAYGGYGAPGGESSGFAEMDDQDGGDLPF